MDGQEANGTPFDLRDQRVQFHISDVYVPEPAQILTALHARDLLDGRVVGLSDHGAVRNAFAVIELEGISQRVVVPVVKLVRRQSQDTADRIEKL